MEISYINAEMSGNFAAAVRLGAAAGLRTVDIRGSFQDSSAEKIDGDDILFIKDILAQHGMRVGMLMPPVGKCDIEDPEAVRKHIEIFRTTAELAHKLGTNLVRTFPFRRPGYCSLGFFL